MTRRNETVLICSIESDSETASDISQQMIYDLRLPGLRLQRDSVEIETRRIRCTI